MIIPLHRITPGLALSALCFAQTLLASEKTSVASGPPGARTVLTVEVTDQPKVVFEWWDLWGEADARIATIQERHVGYSDLQHSQLNTEYKIPVGAAPKRYFRQQTITHSWADGFFYYTAQTNQGNMSLVAQVNGVGETEVRQSQLNQVVTNRWMDVQGYDMYGPFGPEYIERWTHAGTARLSLEQRLPVFDGTTLANDGKPGSVDQTQLLANARPAPFWAMGGVGWGFWGGDFMGHSGNPLNPDSPFKTPPTEWTPTRAAWSSVNANKQFSYTLEFSNEDTPADVQDRLEADRQAGAFENIPWGTDKHISFGGHKTEDHSAFDGSSVWIYNSHSAFAATGEVYEQTAQVRFVTPAALRIPDVAYRARLIQYFYADSDPGWTPQVKQIFEVELKEGQWESPPLTPVIPAEDGTTVLEYFSMMAEPINLHPILPRPPGAGPGADAAPREYVARRPAITPQAIAGGNGSRYVLNDSVSLQQINLSDSWGAASNWSAATANWTLVPGATAQVRLWRWTDDGSPLGIWSLVGPAENLAQYFGSSTDFFFAEALGFGRATLRITLTINGEKVHDDIDIRTAAAECAVDANRDGQIKLASEDAADVTSADKPYRFWLNDDDDGNALNNEQEVYGGTAKDYESRGDFGIASKRDLEDFARLCLNTQGMNDAFKNGDLQLGLRWKTDSVTGAPAINLYRHFEANGGTGYLTDNAIAIQQTTPPYSTTLLDATGKNVVSATNGVFVFKKEIFAGLSDSQPKTHFLFEGAGIGKGMLQIVILDRNGAQIGDGPGLWLDLVSLKSMYQRVKVTPRDPSGIPAPFTSATTFDANGSGTEPSDDGYPFVAPADEGKTALVFVHGSNIPYGEALWNAETMFKRLYWQGYKGRFVLFYWDTLVGPFDGEIPAHYNLNEYRALKYGWALKNYVEGALPSDYAHNVIGHSMGNAVIASALRAREAVNGSVIPGMTARNVVFLEAAVPASSFDSGAATLAELAAKETPQTTPDGIGQLGYRGMVETGVNATLFNVYNVNDYALGWWVTNQRLMKPEDLFYRGYARKYTWTTTGGGQLFDWTNISAGPIRMRYLDDISESMAFVARSRTTAAGRKLVGGSISNNFNVGEGSIELAEPFGDTRADHSGAFTRRIQQLDPLYRYIFERARQP